MNNDLRLSGKGSVPTGEYENIRVSGSGRLTGHVKCQSLSASGTLRGESLQCVGRLKASGSTAFSGGVEAGSVKTSGSFSCDTLTVQDRLELSGSTKCEKSVTCGSLTLSGSLRVAGDLSARELCVSGALECPGEIGGEQIRIKFSRGTKLGNLTGETVSLRRHTWHLCLFGKRRLSVASITGKTVSLKHVTCPRVTGDVVTVGRGCKIDLLQYTQEVHISPRAQVGRVEKL